MYFNLVRTWGAVQLDTLPTAGSSRGDAHRTPVGLGVREGHHPRPRVRDRQPAGQADEILRATKGAAQTLLAEVYLTRAAAGDFDKARDLADGGHQLGHVQAEPELPRALLRTENGNGACDYAASQKTDPGARSSPCTFIGDGAHRPFGNSLHLYWMMGYDGSGARRPDAAAHARRTAVRIAARDRRCTCCGSSTARRTAATRTPSSGCWRQPNGDTAIYFPGTLGGRQERQGKKYGESEYTSLLFPTLLKWLDQTRADPNTFPGHRDRHALAARRRCT